MGVAPTCVGRRPQPKSNEFGETTVTLVELLKKMLIKAAFSNKCCTFLYFKPIGGLGFVFDIIVVVFQLFSGWGGIKWRLL